MYILTSKYFPTGSWPDLYFPALPEGVVDIQYKEVVEFSLAIAATAEFDVVLPNDASVDVVSTDIIVSGAEYSAANGTYVESGTFEGRPNYIHESNVDWFLRYEGGVWAMYDLIAHIFFYVSFDDVATPDLCSSWVDVNNDLAPSSLTVTAANAYALTEVAAFTVEMPMVVEMEVYEELSL